MNRRKKLATSRGLRIESFQDFFIKFDMYASSGNMPFFTKYRHCQTYQNYEQSRQKLDTFLGYERSSLI